MKDSGYISSQCSGSTEIEIGTVYAAEMGITLFSEIDRYTLEDAKVELSYHLRPGDGRFEEVPMEISIGKRYQINSTKMDKRFVGRIIRLMYSIFKVG